MRVLAFSLALAGVLSVWMLPFRQFGLEPFTIHMVRHMMLVAVAAPLFVLAAGRRLAAFSPGVLVAAVLEFLVVWGWHVPALHEAAAVSTGIFVLEQASFLLIGLLLWGSVLRAPNGLAAAGGLLITSMHMTLLGALLVLATRPLYAAVCFGAEPMADQQMGGMLMLAIGTPIYLIAGVLVLRSELAEPEEVRP